MTGNTRWPRETSGWYARAGIPVAAVLSALLGLACLHGCSGSTDDETVPPSPVPGASAGRAHDPTAGAVHGPDPGRQAVGRSARERGERAVIAPRVPRTGDTLSVQVEPPDPARDGFLSYRWFVNREEAVEGRNTFAGEFRRGDEISVTVLGAGGFGADVPLTDTVRVGNAPPHVEDLTPARFEDGTYSTRIVAGDPDGDPLSFSLVKGPPGLVVDDRGEITWVPGEDDFGRHEVAVSIRDGAGGEVVYTYAFSIERR